jgi:hypothetical protein
MEVPPWTATKLIACRKNRDGSIPLGQRVLRKLRSRLELSDVAIARRLGVTREAIRLARNRMGIMGRGRERLRVIQERHRKQSEKRSRQQVYERNPLLQEIKRKAAERGVVFQLLTWPPLGRWIRLANRVCYLSRAGTYSPKHTKLSYVVLARPKTGRDFDVAVVKLQRGWMVFPPDKLPRVTTLFVVGRKKKNPGKKCNRRDWANYYYSGWDWLGEFPDPESTLR